MSYEGYEQHICANGHRYDGMWNPVAALRDQCPCGAKSAWHNNVDQTRGEEYGYIPPEEFAKLLIAEAGDVTFRIPKFRELHRYWRPLEKNGELTKLYRYWE